MVHTVKMQLFSYIYMTEKTEHVTFTNRQIRTLVFNVLLLKIMTKHKRKLTTFISLFDRYNIVNVRQYVYGQNQIEKI